MLGNESVYSPSIASTEMTTDHIVIHQVHRQRSILLRHVRQLRSDRLRALHQRVRFLRLRGCRRGVVHDDERLLSEYASDVAFGVLPLQDDEGLL